MERRQECQRNRRVRSSLISARKNRGREIFRLRSWRTESVHAHGKKERLENIKVKDEEEKCKKKGGTCKAREEEEKELLHT